MSDRAIQRCRSFVGGVIAAVAMFACAGDTSSDNGGNGSSSELSDGNDGTGPDAGDSKGVSSEDGGDGATTSGGQDTTQGSDGLPTGGGPSTESGDTGTSDDAIDCKRGIPFDRWVNQPSVDDLQVLDPDVAWFYNWNNTQNPTIIDEYLDLGFEWVPMVWNGDFDTQTVIDNITSDARYLLGFNEPNIRGNGGVDMTVEEVVELWPELEAIADAHDLTLVSPALTFTNIPGGLDGPEFLTEMLRLCPSCRIDAIAMHSYTCEARWLDDHLDPYRDFGLPIWVTEFACWDGDPQVVETFMRDAVELLENDAQIERYSWFMSRAGSVSLLGDSGQLTQLGELYVSLPHAQGCSP